MCLTGSGMILFTRNNFKFLKQVESKTSQFEIAFKSLAPFSTQLRKFKTFTCYKLRKFGDKSHNGLVSAGRAEEYGPLN